MKYKLAFVGFGTVGQGLAKLLLDKKYLLKQKYDFEYEIVGICDIIKGSLINERGIDLGKILSLIKETNKISDEKIEAIALIKNTNADIIIEVTYTNLDTGEPALTHIKTALELKKHVVTTNKGPIALAYRELKEIATKNNVYLRFEGTVLSGTPVINLATECLAGTSINSIRGILNSATNHIITELEKGIEYDDALKKAQELGYTEADPRIDLEGLDSVAKIIILANVLMGGNLKVKDVKRRGITEITSREIQALRAKGKRIKLIAKAWEKDGKIKASVTSEVLSVKDFLASISGVMNAVVLEVDTLGEVTIIGPGAGGIAAGQALLSDLLTIHRMKIASAQ